MSVYSYVELKVHTNVQKVGTHSNVCLINRTYVRWKYTCLFAYKKYCSLYIMNISLSRPFPPFPFSIILYLYKGNTLSRTYLLPRTFLTLSLFTLLLYTLYIERNILSRNFLPFSRPFHSFIILLIYREWYTLSRPFLPLYKVNTFTPPLSLSFWNVTYGKSLRGKVFENFISIVL